MWWKAKPLAHGHLECAVRPSFSHLHLRSFHQNEPTSALSQNGRRPRHGDQHPHSQHCHCSISCYFTTPFPWHNMFHVCTSTPFPWRNMFHVCLSTQIPWRNVPCVCVCISTPSHGVTCSMFVSQHPSHGVTCSMFVSQHKPHNVTCSMCVCISTPFPWRNMFHVCISTPFPWRNMFHVCISTPFPWHAMFPVLPQRISMCSVYTWTVLLHPSTPPTPPHPTPRIPIYETLAHLWECLSRMPNPTSEYSCVVSIARSSLRPHLGRGTGLRQIPLVVTAALHGRSASKDLLWAMLWEETNIDQQYLTIQWLNVIN